MASLTGYEFEQTWGDSEGQGSLACCSPWGLKASDVTEQVDDNIYVAVNFFQLTLAQIGSVLYY